MVSFRFPFSFPPPTPSPHRHRHRRFISAAATTVAAAATAVVVAGNTNIKETPLIQNALNFIVSNTPLQNSSPFWASLSLSDTPASGVVESKSGALFPLVLKETQRLVGVGLRKKSVLGVKSINVYAFGVYANEGDVRKLLNEKYGSFPVSELKEDKGFKEDILASDVSITVRLQIVYSRLSIRSVRSAFEESVGSRLQKFGGPNNKDLLHRFTSQFKDELKIPKGSVIELSKQHGYVLSTTIDGKEVESIQSKLLCQSVLDLYIGEDPFDHQAKEEVMVKLASLVKK